VIEASPKDYATANDPGLPRASLPVTVQLLPLFMPLAHTHRCRGMHQH